MPQLTPYDDPEPLTIRRDPAGRGSAIGRLLVGLAAERLEEFRSGRRRPCAPPTDPVCLRDVELVVEALLLAAEMTPDAAHHTVLFPLGEPGR